MNRRDFTKTFLGAAAAVPLAAESTPTLREAGAKKNLLVGTAVSYSQLQRPDFTRLLAEQASIVVSENDMKWGPLRPTPDTFDFKRADALVAFAQQHNQKVRGHNLCWHQQLPKWFNTVATRQNAADLLKRHIQTVVTRYAGKIQSWDVVNEAIHLEDGRPDGLRNSPWLQMIGRSYIEIAFRTARAYDPDAILTYNDYDLAQDTPANEAKRKAVLQLLTTLKDQDVPVQALGIQSHLTANPSGDYEWGGFDRFVAEVERLGLQLFITELDVNDRALPGSVAERDSGVAHLYRSYLDAALRHPSFKDLLTWGLTDQDTWLNGFRRRSDGLPQRPLPFDGDLRPTPVFNAMLDSISAAPVRQSR